ncbi:ABC transporter permease subunit [Gayadomonas joobiniege]|uniref:ABC transporter permease subunit n=1 Tax=Gayadomonas joobiniege TaxID=1234606 RepID=UPI0003819B3A|nr:ABC transporter permease subunit [Gayadomonas joobiniege]
MFFAIFKREFVSFFATPVAYVFMLIFLSLAAVFTFYLGNFYERGQADLGPFFNYLPWLYLFLAPALAMKSWAEEIKSGSIELLMTLPVKVWQAVLAKFFAIWLVLGLALALTFPLWLTAGYLGEPDHPAILTSYLASWLLAGAYVAISCCMSACTQNQVIAFILSVVVCFIYLLIGSSIFTQGLQTLLPSVVLDTLSSMGFLNHFEALSKGVVAASDVTYFILVSTLWLLIAGAVLNNKKSA